MRARRGNPGAAVPSAISAGGGGGGGAGGAGDGSKKQADRNSRSRRESAAGNLRRRLSSLPGSIPAVQDASAAAAVAGPSREEGGDVDLSMQQEDNGEAVEGGEPGTEEQGYDAMDESMDDVTDLTENVAPLAMTVNVSR